MDDNDLIFYSKWEIDQLLANAEVTVSSGSTQIYTIASATEPNYCEVQFQPTGSTRWFQAGEFSTNNVSSGLTNFDAYLDGTGLYVRTSVAGTARYFIWGDKVNH